MSWLFVPIWCHEHVVQFSHVWLHARTPGSYGSWAEIYWGASCPLTLQFTWHSCLHVCVCWHTGCTHGVWCFGRYPNWCVHRCDPHEHQRLGKIEHMGYPVLVQSTLSLWSFGCLKLNPFIYMRSLLWQHLLNHPRHEHMRWCGYNHCSLISNPSLQLRGGQHGRAPASCLGLWNFCRM